MPTRIFIDVHLRQWGAGFPGLALKDLDGNTVVLDGLIHDRPHQFILCEIDDPTQPITLPVHFTDYESANGGPRQGDNQAPVSAANPRIPCPKPQVALAADGSLMLAGTSTPAKLSAQGVLLNAPPAVVDPQVPGVAAAPLGVQAG